MNLCIEIWKATTDRVPAMIEEWMVDTKPQTQEVSQSLVRSVMGDIHSWTQRVRLSHGRKRHSRKEILSK